MHMTHEKLDGGITVIRLDGRLDREGTESIDLKFTALAAAAKASVVVDLSRVSFIASIGMRTLISSAKAQANRGGRMVLVNPAPNVRDTLTTAGIDTIIPMYDDMDAAIQSFAADD